MKTRMRKGERAVAKERMRGYPNIRILLRYPENVIDLRYPENVIGGALWQSRSRGFDPLVTSG